MNSWNNLCFQDASSPIMEWLILFHDYTLFINLITTITIMITMMKTIKNNLINLLIENQLIEIIWTILPVIVLIFLAIPSLKLLYLMDEMYQPMFSIKCLGNQWFWTYELTDFMNSSFESYMNKDINMNSFRLLDVDTNLILPLNTQLRLLISSNDVIHSFTIPSMGLKMDGIPGRLNQSNLYCNRPGMFFGQCSEICGANHSFMPICIEMTNLPNFINWINLITKNM
uniref:Cytochrome c oxidase subunit 2 n=1 Tax=Trybliographa sp. ZJUH 20220008 TaxID=2943454 RepID=A0A9E8K004_9HYME|nr:cytochrome c oxidase subunit 2 [Trybliographa sp. ZJUH 20220008]